MRPVSSTVAGRRLADVVKEDAENQRERNLVRQKLEHDAGVLEDVAFGMKLRRLLAAFHRATSGKICAMSPLRSSRSQPRTRCGERKMRTSSSRIRSALISLMPGAAATDRRPGRGLDLKLQHGRETDRAQEPQTIFGEALRRLADRPNDCALEIGAAADEVDHGLVRRIVKHAVDREVAPARVFFRRGEVDFRRPPPVEISAIGAEGRDLDLEAVFHHDDDAEMRAHRVSAREDFLHFFRPRARSRCRNPSAFSRGAGRARSRPRNRRRDPPRAAARRASARSFPSVSARSAALRLDFRAARRRCRESSPARSLGGYCARSATIGFTRVARSAGTRQATAATAASSAATAL